MRRVVQRIVNAENGVRRVVQRIVNRLGKVKHEKKLSRIRRRQRSDTCKHRQLFLHNHQSCYPREVKLC